MWCLLVSAELTVRGRQGLQRAVVKGGVILTVASRLGLSVPPHRTLAPKVPLVQCGVESGHGKCLNVFK